MFHRFTNLGGNLGIAGHALLLFARTKLVIETYPGNRRKEDVSLESATLQSRVKHLETVTEELHVTMSEIESKLISMQQQLVSISIKLNESRRESRIDMYLAAVLLGAVSFLILKAVP